MAKPKPSREEHDQAIFILPDFTVRYRRNTHTFYFYKDDQRCIYAAFEELRDLKGITKRFNEYVGQGQHNKTVIGAVVRRMRFEISNRASMPQAVRAHWNYVATGQEADQPSSPTQQANDPQRAATQYGSGPPAYDDADHDGIDFDEGETSQSMNTTRVRREPPRMQRAVTPAHDLDIPDMIDAFGKKLETSRGPAASRPTSIRQTGSRQTELEQRGMSPGLNVAELMGTFEKDLDSRRGQTDRGRGQTEQRQGRTDYGQQETSDKIDVAELMGTFGKKLESAREQEGRSSSRAAGKRKYQR